MDKKSKEESMDLFINEALRGKAYLDIDRVITEGKTKSGKFQSKDK